MAATEPTAQGLTIRTGADGSFSLWSEAFGEGFHSSRGALREARETFLNPSQLERFSPGRTIRVLEVCVGTGCNLAVLLEACRQRDLELDWIGLELDPEPLRLALGQPEFRRPWQPRTLATLEQLQRRGAWRWPVDDGAALPPNGAPQHSANPPANRDAERWHGEILEPFGSALSDTGSARPGASRAGGSSGLEPCPGGATTASRGRLLWGDARRTLGLLRPEPMDLDSTAPVLTGPDDSGGFDLIWQDAFSPQRCPQLWTVEFLSKLIALLRPEGRWISYCSAAAVREALRLAGMQVVALHSTPDALGRTRNWSGGTLASPGAWPPSALWRALTPMEEEHLACSAGEPYRDPCGTASAAAILAARQRAQTEALRTGQRGSRSAWRQRWGVEASSQGRAGAGSAAAEGRHSARHLPLRG